MEAHAAFVLLKEGEKEAKRHCLLSPTASPSTARSKILGIRTRIIPRATSYLLRPVDLACGVISRVAAAAARYTSRPKARCPALLERHTAGGEDLPLGSAAHRQLDVEVHLTKADPYSSRGQAAAPNARQPWRCSNAAACPTPDAGSVVGPRWAMTGPTTCATSSGTYARWWWRRMLCRVSAAGATRSTGGRPATSATARVNPGASWSKKCSAGSRRSARAAICAA